MCAKDNTDEQFCFVCLFACFFFFFLHRTEVTSCVVMNLPPILRSISSLLFTWSLLSVMNGQPINFRVCLERPKYFHSRKRKKGGGRTFCFSCTTQWYTLKMPIILKAVLSCAGSWPRSSTSFPSYQKEAEPH